MGKTVNIIFGEEPFPDIIKFVGTAFLCVCIRTGMTYFLEIYNVKIGAVVKTHIREELFDKVLDLGPGYIMDQRSGKLQSVLMDGMENLYSLSIWTGLWINDQGMRGDSEANAYCISWYLWKQNPLGSRSKSGRWTDYTEYDSRLYCYMGNLQQYDCGILLFWKMERTTERPDYVKKQTHILNRNMFRKK